MTKDAGQLPLTSEEKERNFLEACGFDLSHGFYSEDVSRLRVANPELYKEYVTLW